MLPRWLRAISPKKEGETRQGGASIADPRQASAPIGTPHNHALTTVGALASTQISCVDAHHQGPSEDIGTPRLLGCGVRPLLFVPMDDPAIPPERYKTLRFLPYSEIAEAFVEWMLTDPRTAYLIGWPIAAYEVWTLAEEVFCPATKIAIESRNNFFAALAKRPEVNRTRNKRVRNDAGGWSKTTVYRFLTSDQRAEREVKLSANRVGFIQ